ncbi:hypothetical protein [Paracoccus sp. NSM]|uniref:hypothetical protein n=1 Tax=Paracoccus sp. NSM TaxID=3457784 RepID=UPI0040369A4B
MRRGAPSVGIGFEDGSAVRIHPDIVLLQRRGIAPVSMARSFARALAQAKRWISGTEDMALPQPRPNGLGTPLAGTKEALRAHMAVMLRGCRPVCLADDPVLHQRAAAIWTDFVGAPPDVAGHSDVVLVLSPRCLRALATPGARTMARIEALSARHPKIIVAAFLTQDGVPRLLSMDRLKEFVQSRSKEADRVVEMNPPEKGKDPGPDFH